MDNVLVKIVRLVEDGQPPFVECEFEDATGCRHTFLDKEPIFTAISPQRLPQIGFIRCEVLQRWTDSKGQELARISTMRPDGVESTTGLTEFTVFSDSVFQGTWQDGSLSMLLK
jgi:hypothetical protein